MNTSRIGICVRQKTEDNRAVNDTYDEWALYEGRNKRDRTNALNAVWEQKITTKNGIIFYFCENKFRE